MLRIDNEGSPKDDGAFVLYAEATDKIAALKARVAGLERVLEHVEWSHARHTATGSVSGGRSSRACPNCWGIHPDDTHPDWPEYGHFPDCFLNGEVQTDTELPTEPDSQARQTDGEPK